jgi:hypothetical protein
METVKITPAIFRLSSNFCKRAKPISPAESVPHEWIHGKKRSRPELQIRSDVPFLWTGRTTQVALSKLFAGKTPASLFPLKGCTDTFPLFWAQLASD